VLSRGRVPCFACGDAEMRRCGDAEMRRCGDEHRIEVIESTYRKETVQDAVSPRLPADRACLSVCLPALPARLGVGPRWGERTQDPRMQSMPRIIYTHPYIRSLDP
jgi:hypothetical protein